MIKNMLIALIVTFVLFEIIEHVVVPLVGFLLGRKRRSISGAEGMVGKVVKVKQWNTTEGQVFVNGELWRAICEVPLVKGDKAIIHNVEGLTLKVEPFND
jgi:membrane-bound serine protease (ClpP class)